MSAIQSSGAGPVFIVGMPRSGTKLLRELLNNHSRIAIPRFETEFLPFWVKRWDSFGDLSDWQNFKLFYKNCLDLPYFLYQRREGQLIDPHHWHRSCAAYTPAEVFAALVRHDAGAGKGVIWGDKSPSYIRHVGLIKAQFPDARIVHVVRDVRDYCLSIRQAWGKSMLRAAQRWTDDIERARLEMQPFRDSFFEVQYEKLIAEPDAEMRRLCAFLDLLYEPGMTQLSRSIENRGRATGEARILQDNAGKWRRAMRPATRRRIEEIACRVLQDLGYAIDEEVKPRRLSAMAMAALKATDGVNLMAAHWRDRGTIGAVVFHLQQRRLSQVRSHS